MRLRNAVSLLLLLVLAWAVGPSLANSQERAAAPAEQVLERAEIVPGERGAVDLVFHCQPAPSRYSLTRTQGGSAAVVLRLPGFRLRKTTTEADGSSSLRLSEDGEGVRAEFRGAGLQLREVRLEGMKLLVSLSPRGVAAGDAPVETGTHQPWGDTAYRVGPGDLLTIAVFGQDDLSKSVRVLSNGTISFPLVGNLLVAGLTPVEIALRLTDLLASDYVINPQVLVGVSEYQSQWVNVIGEVRRPDKYFLKGPTRLIDLLSEAGGLTESAGSEVVITRSEGGQGGDKLPRQIRVSIEALFAGTGDDDNVPLEAGDVVHVHQARNFYIRGEVGRPGQYPVRSETTIQKAISLAGGLTQWADEKEIQLIRGAGDAQKKILINLRKIGKGQAPDIKIEPDDIILVSRRIL